MQIAIPMYDRFTALDAIGPYEVLSRLPEADVVWLAHEPGLVRTDNRMLWLGAQIAGEDWAKAIQLIIEYDPQPPFDSGSTAKAPAELVARIRGAAKARPGAMA